MAAAAGGGKIRTRRYHIAAKPYAKSKQGLISRVTDTVKSIVPGWLQKYFSKGEDGCVDARETRETEESGEVDLRHTHAGDGDPAPLHDGRVTPEPETDDIEPSTSRSTLNYPDVLTRPSLHRTNLNFTMSDPSALHCQPSTSSALPIGSSGFSLVKEIKDSASQHDDDNISTTSGFSSRASDKDVAVSKSVPGPPLWSPDVERSHSFSQHNSISTKKPAFNPSALVTLSPSLGNAAILKNSHLGDSPFYPGKTTYGGAAATRLSKTRATPYQAPLRRQVKAKQASTQTYGVTSSTARRILQSLEKMSSPLADAKRIPSVGSSPLSPTLDMADFQARKRKVDAQYPPVQKLMTPKVLNVSSNRSMYIKPSLTPAVQPSKSGRRAEGKRREVREKDRAPEPQLEPPESFSYPRFSTPAANGLPTGSGKMRRERGTHYVAKGDLEDEEVSVSELPKIALPISSTALPSFSFSSSSSPLSSTSSSSMAQPMVNKVQPNTSSRSSPVFTFSSPIMKSTKTDVLPLEQAKDFTFSAPALKSTSMSASTSKPVPVMFNSPAKETVTMNSTSTRSKKGNHETFEGPFRPAKSLKEGNVLDILRSPDFLSPKTTSHTEQSSAISRSSPAKPAANSSVFVCSAGFGEHLKQAPGQWQCSACLVQNKVTDSKCVACQTAKAPSAEAKKQADSADQGSSTKPTSVAAAGTQGFGDRFKLEVGTWDCDTCLVQNKAKATKCVACETPKPGTGVKPALPLSVTTSHTPILPCTQSFTSDARNTTPLGFGDKFIKPPGAWNCTVCLVQNKAEDSKCVACLAEKPGGSSTVATSTTSATTTTTTTTTATAVTTSVPALSTEPLGFGDKFKKPEGSWDCSSCLVQNKSDALKCIACESPKPGTPTEFKGFGSTAASTPTFKFGLQSTATSLSSQTGESQSGTKCQEQGNFKFGVSSSDSESCKSIPPGGFSFSNSVAGFKFGVSSSDSKHEESKKNSSVTTTSSSSFSFGVPVSLSKPQLSVPSSGAFTFSVSGFGQQNEKKEAKLSSGFSFGTSCSTAPVLAEGTSGAVGFKDSFDLKKQDAPAPTSFSFSKAEKKDNGQHAGWGSDTAFGKPEPVKEQASSTFGLLQAEGKQDALCTPAPVFGKKVESTELKPLFQFGKTEPAKEESTTRPTFNFSVGKSTENKETEPPAKSAFAFGSSTDQGAVKPAFSFLSTGSSGTSVSSTASGTGSIFGNSSSASTSTAGTFMFGQTGSSNANSSAFSSTTEPSVPQAFTFTTIEGKTPAAPSAASGTGTMPAPAPFVFGIGSSGSSSNSTTSGFNFGATTTTSSTGTTSSPFVFGSGSSVVGPRFGASQTSSFGQSQSSGQPSIPAFGTISSSSSFFPTNSQTAPTFGALPSGNQPPAFGQQVSQPPAFGSTTAPPAAGSGFQFGGNTSFNFSSGTPSGGIFTFGSSAGGAAPGATQSPASSNFTFNQPQGFTVGSNGKSMFSASGSSVSSRRIKTAIRRRK